MSSRGLMRLKDLEIIIYLLKQYSELLANQSCDDLDDKVAEFYKSTYTSKELCRLEEDYQKYNCNDLMEFDRKNPENWVILNRDNAMVDAMISRLQIRIKK